MNLSDNVTLIKGIGEKTALLFSKASVFSVNDLIHYFPRRYELFPEQKNICDLVNGDIAVVKAKVVRDPVFTSTKTKKKLLNIFISDRSSNMKVLYFNMPYMKNQFWTGKECIFYGTVKYIQNMPTMVNPKVISLEEYENSKGKLLPVYPLVKGLGNATLQNALKEVFNKGLNIKDYLSVDIKKNNNLTDINDALYLIHFPQNMNDVYKARRRLAFDEFFFFCLKINSLKSDKGKQINPYPVKEYKIVDEILRKLPFELTNGQKAALSDIKNDLASGCLMNRLIQGDVGCGKTIIALLSCFLVNINGFQSVIMAPTEVLARQHFADVLKMIEYYNLDFLKPVLLVGSLKASEKKCVQNAISSGDYNLIIGTHALIQDKVKYKNLALAITDEQHRFGVKQRLSLMNAGDNVNVLVLSATPIPRTLGLVLYGDMDVSVIKDLPSNRLPIKNSVLGESYRQKIFNFIYNRIKEGRQAYIICPMVEEGELDNVQNVTDYSEKLRNVFPPEIKIATLHGKLKATEKDDIMNKFKNNDFQILVSTTVVEVGVNVPNATVILIENAERFGLASLHQLRGRVGRGEYQSYCMFLCSSDSEKALKKLEILGKSNDGFEIASEDLKQRGPGDFFGIKQSGLPEFKVADIYTDSEVLTLAKDISLQLINGGETDKYNEIVAAMDAASIIDFHAVCL